MPIDQTRAESGPTPPLPDGVGQNPAIVAGKWPTPFAPLRGWPLFGPDPHPWRVVAEVASLQTGCVAHGQLTAVGLNDQQTDYALRTGRLRRCHRGVYELERSDRAHSREAAALLAVWPDATLTGLSVLGGHQVIPADARRAVDVAVLGAARRSHSRGGIAVHRYGDLRAADVRIVNGLSMTTVERALLDAADKLDGRELERAVDEALAARLTSRTKVRETAEPAVGRRGPSQLLALAEARRPGSLTRREAAELALKLMRAAGLPAPQTEVSLLGFSADFFFAEARRCWRLTPTRTTT